MGADLGPAPPASAPSFLVHALKDPDSANLDRVQIVKGWRTASGALAEKAYDVALSDGRAPGRLTGRVPTVGHTVDVETASFEKSIGDAMLSAVWVDPGFDPAEQAFYCARVIEIPTPRWTA